MKTFFSVVVVIILMLLGFWYYMDKKCTELENANNLAISEAVTQAVDSVNSHHALDVPLRTYHVYKAKQESSEESKKTVKKTAPVKKSSNVFTDKRDGKKYMFAEFGDQIWMIENLDFKTKNSKCYDQNPKNCEKWGALYPWNDAMVACPEGWHLPNDAEWSELINNYGGVNEAGARLKKGGDSGFNVLWAGYHDKKDFYGKGGVSSYFWSSTEQNDLYASFKGIYSTADNVGTYTYTKADGMSVRCIKD